MFDNLRTAINELTAEVRANASVNRDKSMETKINGVRIDTLNAKLDTLNAKLDTLTGEISKLTEAVKETPAPTKTENQIPVNVEDNNENAAEEKATNGHRFWPKDETDRLIELRVKGTPLKDIYKAFPDRTERAIDNKLSKLKLKGLIKASAVNEPKVDVKVSEPKTVTLLKKRGGKSLYRYWTDVEDRTLVDLILNGYPIRKIATILGRTENSVYQRARNNGLIKKAKANSKNA